MIVVLLCCMMKIVEFSTGKPQENQQKPRGKYRRYVRRRKQGSAQARRPGMSEATFAGGTPDSDCNSNPRPASSASLLSNASDADFHDNSDYQWFLDYGYRDAISIGSTHNQHHPSILSLGGAYDALAADLDANLAEADMDTFRTSDIHALLTHLPPMCSENLPHELQGGRQGESYAELSASLLSRLGLEGSLSPASGSQADLSASGATASICKSEPLFSPIREAVPPPPSFSVDSLDCDMMLTCQANKDNYTIAFEGSLTADSEESDYREAEKNSASHHATSLNYPMKEKPKLTTSMTQSDNSSLTTWSKLKKRSSEDQLRRTSGNNNNNSGDEGNLDSVLKSASLPNLYKQRLRNLIACGDPKSNSNSSSGDTCTVKRRPVKVFDIQHQLPTSSGSEMATSADASSSENQPKLNLVKLFMRQKSMSAEGMSTTLDQLSSSYESGESHCSNESNENKAGDRPYGLIAEEPEEELSRSPSVEPLSESVSAENSFEKTPRNLNNNNNSFQKSRLPSPQKKVHRMKSECLDRSIQTSQFSEILSLKNAGRSGSSRESVRLIDPSFLSKLKKEGEIEKPVYVLYPNYVLPDLNFLKEKPDVSKLLFVPQKAPPIVSQPQKRRPFSFNDIEMLKKKGFHHVKDWDSLNVLLPPEYKKILAELPEVSEHITQKDKRNFAAKKRPLSCDLNQTNVSSSSSTATQPSSGYRGSSTMLSDSQNSPAPQNNHNPLFVYRYDSVTSSEASLMNSEKNKSVTTTAPQAPMRRFRENVPPRPPLPRGILRKGLEKVDPSKRYSVYETSEEEIVEDANVKRRSFPEPYYLQRNKRMSETEDEGIDFGTSGSSLEENNETQQNPEVFPGNISVDELVQLEEFLKMSGLSSDEEKATEESLTHLRSYVSKFLSLKINQEGGIHFGGKKTVSFAEKANLLQAKHFVPPNNSPNVSAFLQQKNYQPKNVVDLTICEEGEHSPNYRSPQTTPVHLLKTPADNLLQKRSLIKAVTDAVEQIVQHFSPASDQQELNALGDSSINPASAKLALTTLCPALYALLSDGLKPSIETSFGDISNGVWQVVEATARQGPLTRALQDLVARVNAEDVITEGLLKFNAFVFGLLNVRSLDAWASFLRTRESVLKRHYTADSILLLSHTGGSDIRAMLDSMVASLQPLAFLPFQLDLMFEYRQLHQSFKRMDSYVQPLSPVRKMRSTEDVTEVLNVSKIKERPRSCLEPVPSNKAIFRLGEDVSNVAKKRWSGIAPNSKLYQVYDRLAREDEEYVDSLETPTEDVKPIEERELESLDSNPSDEKPLNGRRFRKLQQRWEMLSNGESSEGAPTQAQPTKSRIPRPITSPVRPSGIPVPVSPTCKKVVSSPTAVKACGSVKNSPARKPAAVQRTSRVDLVDNEAPRHVTRPSSLPYKPSQQGKGGKVTPPRRAASSSLNRKTTTGNGRSETPKFVRTVTQRVPSESGHLPFTRGERLKVALVVDERWLVCARRGRQGLVPRSAVVADREEQAT